MEMWQQIIKRHLSVIFKLMLFWGVELCQGYRTVAFVQSVVAQCLPAAVINARNNEHPTVFGPLKRQKNNLCYALHFSCPHTDSAIVKLLK